MRTSTPYNTMLRDFATLTDALNRNFAGYDFARNGGSANGNNGASNQNPCAKDQQKCTGGVHNETISCGKHRSGASR